MEIVKLADNTWRIEDEGVRFFLLAGENRALLIDSGMQIHNAKDIAQQLVSQPIELLNTHADMDHIGSNEQFASFYMHPAEASNYYNTQGKQGTFIPVADGDIIDLGNRTLKILSIPGHTPGSIAILDMEQRVLYSGDTIQDGVIFMFGVQREMHAYLHSLKKLEALRSCFDQIYPSHGNIPLPPSQIDLLYQAALDIMENKIEGKNVNFHGISIKKYTTSHAIFLCDRFDE